MPLPDSQKGTPVPLVSNTLLKRLSGSSVIGLLILGWALRCIQYGYDRALRLDEAALALNIIELPWAELWGPLQYSQNSPLAFLFLIKALISVLGQSEYVLRLIPLLCGLITLPFFYVLARQVSMSDSMYMSDTPSSSMFKHNRWDTALVAVAFLAVNKHLLFYTSDLRHYSTDVLLTCILLWYVLRFQSYLIHAYPSEKHMGALMIMGAVAVWFSLASLFVLSSIGIVWIFQSMYGRKYRSMQWAIASSGVWAVSFYVHYLILDLNIAARALGPELLYELIPGGAPFPPQSFADALWYRENFEKLFYFPVGLTFRGLGAFAFLIGCLSLWFRRKDQLFLLTLPIMLVLAASMLGKYPFKDRYILFLVPCLTVLIAEGIVFMGKQGPRPYRWVGTLMFIMLFIQPLVHGVRHVWQPHYTVEVKPMLEKVRDEWVDGGYLYTTWGTGLPTLYYRDRYDLTDRPLTIEPRDHHLENRTWEYREEEWSSLLDAGDPVWLLIEQVNGEPLPTQAGETDYIGYLDQVTHGEGVSLYRYQREEPIYRDSNSF